MSKKFTSQRRKGKLKHRFLNKSETKARKGNVKNGELVTPTINHELPVKLGYLDSEVREEFEKTRSGYIYFDSPQVMVVGNSYRVVAELFWHRNLSQPGSSEACLIEVEVGARMKAKIAGNDFEIVPLNNEDQISLPGNRTMWNWEVKPLRAGGRDLLLGVSLRLNVGSKEECYDNPIHTRRILVKPNRLYEIKMFWIKNWDKLLKIGFGSGILWAVLKLLCQNFNWKVAF